jgi:dTMP kinase
MKPGFFMTFEGGEGAGKSTQIKLLADRLSSFGRKVHVLREPGGTPLGESIRSILKHRQEFDNMSPVAELLLMNASRAQLVHEVIRPALQNGDIVLCDRFYDSTTAYQGYGRKLGGKVQAAIDLAVGDVAPDLTIILHVPPLLGRERRAVQNTKLGDRVVYDRLDAEQLSFFELVELGFQALAKLHDDRIVTLDGTLPILDVAELVYEAFCYKFKQTKT